MEKGVDLREKHLEGDMKEQEKMPCRNCPEGHYQKGEISELMERGNTVVVVRGVPAQVCDTCGDALTTSETTERLLSMLDEAEAAGVESEVRRYREAKAA